MNYEACSQIQYAKSLSEAKRILKKNSQKGLGNAHLQPQGEGYLLFMSSVSSHAAAPYIAKQLHDQEHAFFITMKSEKLIYILVKDNDFEFSEYFITISSASSVDIKKLMTHLFRIGDRLSSFKIFTDIPFETSSNDFTIFNNQFELPVSFKNVCHIKWAKSLSSNLIFLGNHKNIDVIRSTTAKRHVALLATIMMVVSVLLIDDVINNQKEGVLKASGEKNNEVKVITNKEAEPHIQYLTKTGHNTLDVFKNFTRRMNLVNTLVSWEPTEIHLTSLENGLIGMKVKLNPVHESNTSEVIEFAQQNGFATSISSEAAVLTTVLKSRPILLKAYKFHIGTFEHFITKTINAWWDNVTIKVTRAEEKEILRNWRGHEMDVGIKSIEPFDMASLGALLTGLPVGFESMHATKDDPLQPRWDAAFKFKLIGVKYND